MWTGQSALEQFEQRPFRPAFFQDVPGGFGPIPFVGRGGSHAESPSRLVAAEITRRPSALGNRPLVQTASVIRTSTVAEVDRAIASTNNPLRSFVFLSPEGVDSEAGVERLSPWNGRFEAHARNVVFSDSSGASALRRGLLAVNPAQTVAAPSIDEAKITREQALERALGSTVIGDDFTVPYAGIIWALVADLKLADARTLLDRMPDEPQYARIRSLVEPARVRKAAVVDVDRTADYTWLRTHRDEYVNQWVALAYGGVLAAAPTLKVLLGRLKTKNLKAAPLIHFVQ